MFARDKREQAADPHKISTVLGADARIEGTVKAGTSLRVDGWVKGSVEVDGDVMVGDTGEVIARISAHTVRVAGTVRGNICSRGVVELTADAVVEGDVYCDSLIIDKGAVFNGTSHMAGEEEPEAAQSEE